MSPAKGESSSCYKGKKVSTDDLPTEIVGEEAPYSESNCFEEKEGVCDQGSECPPFIDPWYNTNIDFLMVLSD